MKHKVSEIEGALLDAAVAKAEGIPVRWDAAHDFCVCYEGGDSTGLKERRGPLFNPSRVWAQGGPIIEREWIDVEAPCKNGDRNGYWYAYIYKPETAELLHIASGPTPLIAAMRAFVASKLGEEVEL